VLLNDSEGGSHMGMQEYAVNAANKIKVSKRTMENVVIGTGSVVDKIIQLSLINTEKSKHPCLLAFDGNYCVDWKIIINSLLVCASQKNVHVSFISINTMFQPLDAIHAYKKPFIEHDPSLGWENPTGRIQDILDMEKVQKLRIDLLESKKRITTNPELIVVYSPGAAVSELIDVYDYSFYFDMTKDPIMLNLWANTLVSFGCDKPDPTYFWKDLYYVDFHLLDNQKWYIFEHMDFYVEAVDPMNLILIPRKEYDTIMSTLLKYPIKQVRIFMPGAFGGYRYKQLWPQAKDPGNSAWNSISSPKLDFIIDAGGKQIRLPSVNILQYGKEFVGEYWDKECPKWWPLLAAIDDGYFPDPNTPRERTAMCQHNHPSTDYVRRHFNEQFGRYETYYFLEVYENAGTVLGFKDDANLEEWQAKCEEAAKTKSLIPDWQDYVKIWKPSVGDLFLIPPGTTHGHGGRSMVLELDTNVNTTTCEYSFYMHDYGRNTWNDKEFAMTGKKCNLQCEHGFNIDLARREHWVKDHLFAKPEVIKWTPDYYLERFSSLPEMPFHIERFHFKKFAENDTEGKFLNIVTLIKGDNITIQSKNNPEYQTTIDCLQAAAVPAQFGAYKFINNGNDECTVMQIRLKKG